MSLYDAILTLCITTSPTKRFLEHSTSRTHSDTLSFHRFQTFFVTWGLLNIVPTSAQLYLQAAVLTFGLGHSLIFRSARPLGLFFCVSRCALCGDAIWQHFVGSSHDRDHCWLAVCADHKCFLPHGVGDLLHSNRSTVGRRFPRHLSISRSELWLGLAQTRLFRTQSLLIPTEGSRAALLTCVPSTHHGRVGTCASLWRSQSSSLGQSGPVIRFIAIGLQLSPPLLVEFAISDQCFCFFAVPSSACRSRRQH